jgi:hypothetical protein
MTSQKRPHKPEEIVVFDILKPSACSSCAMELPKGSFLRMEKDEPLCLECADLDHLVFLPSGDAALTRRSRKHSVLSAVVVRFSRSRKRYERQGLLVDQKALEDAERECLSDEDQRRVARERASQRRELADTRFISEFIEAILAVYPGCSSFEAEDIARHACEKYSGRVGRSAAAKRFDPLAIKRAVTAHVRHVHSEYDHLLAQGWERSEAREAVAGSVEGILQRWAAAADCSGPPKQLQQKKRG